MMRLRRLEMRTAIGLALVMSVLLVGSPGSAQIADYWGFSDFPQTLGAGMTNVGFVGTVFAPLTNDPGSFEYTYALEGMVLDAIVPMGPATVYEYTGGFFTIYEDAAFNALYDDGACTLSGAGTFTDGTIYLQAEIATLTYIFNTMTNRGSYDAEMTYVAGSHLGELPINERGGTLFGGTTNSTTTACIPDGWIHRWDGQAFTIQDPVPTDQGTWGSVKALFQ
jgi:hypothetical protein